MAEFMIKQPHRRQVDDVWSAKMMILYLKIEELCIEKENMI